MALKNQVQLICYPDRLGRNLADLYSVLDRHCGDRIGGVHILPLYPSNADGGFSPLTHKEVDPAYTAAGRTWSASATATTCAWI